ncbi:MULTISPECIES: DNA repair protein RecN [Petrimonas]|jgi:DNA repair protein RecN (Recombination protein N)|uniref:DNA repair protein RecN n=1 Tax=Petrimonas mucosa TaxID=1642646 RepID=A0A1G4G9J3_9BACT|nr:MULTISPECIES: DNA repair protein RecN [Petrimonas]MDD3560051.1 DNA repair protein RecN [Petrimonas mucosa]SCM59219.1 DNA repair protein RecN [Petrimonas mucosa]SFU30050.1 DNA replication and repair protein RecN [Porphyromonadaceae bacterium KHP3R9]HHT28829.1 DNA repair protein RecN [Petrimonas mucosa]
MLKSLAIENYALIDSLQIDFDKGFSVITGETGAGKSIILGALSLILGQRADSRFIKQNEQKCTIEGIFDLSRYDLQQFFDEREWEYDPDECILRREIWTNGKSRAFVNDSPVYLNDLKELGDRLIDVHSQHQNLSLNDNLYQLNALDILADSKEERELFRRAFQEYEACRKELIDLQEQSRKNREEADYLQFQFDNLAGAKLQAGEQERLEAELETITHAEEIKSSLFAVTDSLSGEGDSVEQRLKTIADRLKGIQRVFPVASELGQRVESAYIELKEVRIEAERYFDGIEYNAGRQQLVEERLSLIYDLQKRHSASSVEKLLEIQEQLENRLKGIQSLDEHLDLLEKEMSEKQQAMLQRAEILSKKRGSALQPVEKLLTEKLIYLGMPNARFRIEVTSKSNPDMTGKDSVNFLFSANKNSPLMPVAQVASGGEISRLMLCLKSMIAGATALPTVIFDEIDTGTSGEIADKMGSIMQDMAHDMQVIAITHLPQIAAKGTKHYTVYKEDRDETTLTRMSLLTPDERVMEIARMLSGAEVTDQAVENARVMLGSQ